MDSQRWLDLEHDPQMEFTRDEVKDGWHRCPDFDFMVVGPDMPEWDCCLCSTPRNT